MILHNLILSKNYRNEFWFIKQINKIFVKGNFLLMYSYFTFHAKALMIIITKPAVYILTLKAF